MSRSTTVAAPAAPAAPQTLPGRLLEALRSPFRVAVIVPDRDDLLLGRPRCAVPGCDRWTQGHRLCGSHYSRWWKAGKPEVAAFAASTGPLRARTGIRLGQCYDLRPLPEGLRLEFAYALQCRAEERGAGLRPGQVATATKLLARSGAGSLFEHPLPYWLLLARQPDGQGSAAEAFLRYAYQRVEDLARGAGPDDEYDRDTWDARRLGLPASGSSYLVRFGGIAQPWLRAAAKRWGRFRLATGKAIGTVCNDMIALTRFSVFLAETAPGGRDASVINRSVLESYLSRLAAADLTARTRLGYLVSVRGFLDACRRHWLAPAVAIRGGALLGGHADSRALPAPVHPRARHGPTRSRGQPRPAARSDHPAPGGCAHRDRPARRGTPAVSGWSRSSPTAPGGRACGFTTPR